VVWLKFILCFAILLFAGTKLARYGDIVAEKTGLGRLWVGLLPLAFITSMPECTTGVSAVALVGVPDLALGTFLGSCLFNTTILAILDILHRHGPVLNKASTKHMLSAGLGISLIAVAAVGIVAEEWFSGLAVGWMGISSIIIIVLYVVGVRAMFRLERRQELSLPEESAPQYEASSMSMVWLKFALAAVVVIGAGIWLSFIGDEIAETTSWATSFVGSLFLAISTSMPELVVAITALRLGAIDLALGNILGANMLNCAFIFIVDLVYTRGPILTLVSESHVITAVVAITMLILVILGLRFQQRRKTFIVVSWYGLAIIGLYLLGAYALYSSGIGL